MVFQEQEQHEEMVQESSPRTEGDFIGFRDKTSDFHESIDITDMKPKVRVLPGTVEGLRNHFHELC